MERTTKFALFIVLLSPVWGMVTPIREEIADDGEREEPVVQVPASTGKLNPDLGKDAPGLVSDLATQPPHVKGKYLKLVLLGKNKAGKKIEVVRGKKIEVVPGKKCRLIGNPDFDLALIIVLILGIGLCIFKLGHEFVRVVYGGRDIKSGILHEDWNPVYFPKANAHDNVV